MGTYIRAVFQKKDGAHWVDVPSDYDEAGDYELFAWLGFGGGRGSFDLEPLAAHPGAPDDFELVDGGQSHPITRIDIHAPSRRLMQARLRAGNFGYMKVCMGSPDIRWLHVDEILAATPPRTMRTVGVPIAFFRTWDGKLLPDRWDLLNADWKLRPPAAPGIYARPYEVGDNTKHVAIDWDFDFADEFRYFLDELRRLKDSYGEVRMVYAFY